MKIELKINFTTFVETFWDISIKNSLKSFEIFPTKLSFVLFLFGRNLFYFVAEVKAVKVYVRKLVIQ